MPFINRFSLRSDATRRGAKIGTLLCLSLHALIAAQSIDPAQSFGVWDRGDDFDPREYPFLRGFACNLSWKDVEAASGQFDWSVLDRAMDKAIRSNRNLYLAINVGPDAPNWIYDQGVPPVITRGAEAGDMWPRYPFYCSDAYRKFFERLIRGFSAKVGSYPRAQQEKIAFVQVKNGCTGDECAYKGNAVDGRFELSTRSSEWRDFRIWAFGIFNDCFQNKAGQRPIPLLFNNVAPDDDSDGGENAKSASAFTREWQWVVNNVHAGYGIKIAGSGRGHHLEGEQSKISTWQPRLIGDPTPPLFARSEMDQTWTHAMYGVNLPMNFYWGAITGLQAGQSIWDISKTAITASKEYGFSYSFDFFNRYAGQTNPTTASAAFCAFHKGLDAADVKSYPEDRYGSATRGNIDRMIKICADYAKYGAAIDNAKDLLLGQVRQRDTQSGLNDVGWDIWPDNYGRFLSQIDPDQTSVPQWRIGGPITKTSSIYDRFGRAFENASGKNAMFFRFAKGFSADDSAKVMTITVVWHDARAGSTWTLNYDGGGNAMKPAMSVRGKGDGQWHHERVTVDDAVFRGGGEKGSDLALINTDSLDDVFSIIEVVRGRPSGPIELPATDFKVRDKTTPPKAVLNEKKKEKAEKSAKDGK